MAKRMRRHRVSSTEQVEDDPEDASPAGCRDRAQVDALEGVGLGKPGAVGDLVGFVAESEFGGGQKRQSGLATPRVSWTAKGSP